MPLLSGRRLAALLENVGCVARNARSADDRAGNVVCRELDVLVWLNVSAGRLYTFVKSAVAQDAPLGVALATTEETTEETADETADILELRLVYEAERCRDYRYDCCQRLHAKGVCVGVSRYDNSFTSCDDRHEHSCKPRF